MSYEDEQIRDRIKKLYHHEDMSMRQFALSIERPPSNFSKILSDGITKGRSQKPLFFIENQQLT